MVKFKFDIWVEHATMPCLDQAQRRREGHLGLGGDFFGQAFVVLVPEFGRRLAERLLALVFGLADAMALVFGQRAHDMVRTDGVTLERFWLALCLILRQRRDD